MYETTRIVEKLKPKYVLWENVKNILSQKHKHNFENYLGAMEHLGYRNYYKVLNAKDFGVPQNRERVFTISIRNELEKEFIFPKKQELKLRLKDMLEQQVDEKYYLSQQKANTIKYTGNEKGIIGKLHLGGFDTNNGVYDTDNECFTLRGKQPDQKILEKIEGQSALMQPVDRKYKEHNTNRQEHLEFKNDDTSHALRTNQIPYTTVEYKTQNKRIQKLANDTELKGTMFMDIYNQKVIDNEVGTLKAGMDKQQGNIIYDQLRIRKLTPRECWRLMGFIDEEYEKAEKVNSNTQLYKQAGNSIVVNVLESIFKNLFKEYIDENNNTDVMQKQKE